MNWPAPSDFPAAEERCVEIFCLAQQLSLPKARQGFSDARKAHFILCVCSTEGLLLSFQGECFVLLFTEHSHRALPGDWSGTH